MRYYTITCQLRYINWFIVFLLLGMQPTLADDVKPTHAQMSYEKTKTIIKTAHGQVPLTLEVASTIAQIEQGLMYRTSVPEGTGMLFLFPAPQDIDFWMKNTLVPLDMLFINEHGIIINIEEDTKPESTRRIPSRGKVTGVIEIAGGSSKRLHIAKGNKVIYPHFHE